jgi:hypothetical protein
MARTQRIREGRDMRAQGINLGKGFAVNPLSSLQTASGAGARGFEGAMQGLGQSARILQDQDIAKYNASAASSEGLWGGLGTLAGVFGPGMMGTVMSSKDSKTGKKKARSVTEALKKVPVEEWEYKAGVPGVPPGRHIGPYAEDWKKEMGTGDGGSIPLQDMAGAALAGVKEIGEKVDRLEKKVGRGVRAA